MKVVGFSSGRAFFSYIQPCMDVSLAPRPQMNPRISFPYLARRKPCGKCSTWVVRMGLA